MRRAARGRGQRIRSNRSCRRASPCAPSLRRDFLATPLHPASVRPTTAQKHFRYVPPPVASPAKRCRRRRTEHHVAGAPFARGNIALPESFLLLSKLDSLKRRAESVTGAGFHFHENDHAAV